jgi:tetratricopeptide (TPR) repeat protein
MARFDKLEFSDGQAPDDAEVVLAADRDATYWMRQADANRRSGNHETALRFYSRSLELDRTNVAGWAWQVRMLVQLGEFSQAELWARKALELFPQHAELLAAGAQAACRNGRLADALAQSDAALARPGESAYRWAVRGELLVARRSSGADHCFDKAVAIDRDWIVPLEIATACLFHAAPAIGLRYAQAAVERDPRAVRAWHVQGQCHDRMGMHAAARRSFEQVLALCPKHVEAEAFLARGDGWWIRLRRRLGGWTGR